MLGLAKWSHQINSVVSEGIYGSGNRRNKNKEGSH
jgi:hypothetical protein